MRIQLFLNNPEEEHIYTFFDMVTNPFNLGDVINLNVSELSPKDYSNLPESIAKNMQISNLEDREKFHFKNIVLIRENKYVDLKDGSIIIEYHCEFTEEK
jgi:hypothetical protein